MYFEKAKQMKRKIQGAKDALEKTRKQLDRLQKEFTDEKKESARKAPVKREWYEKFRWFFTSDDFLVILGRDATTNEIIIKKHTNADDLVLHTDMAGSPFAVIKSEGRQISKEAIEETAIATASYSRAWRLGLSTLDVFYVSPEQVTKKARPGEYLQKGSFMVYGKTSYLHPTLGVAVGVDNNGKVIGGPVNAVKKRAKDFAAIVQGTELPSEIAKKLHKRFNADTDEILRFLPAGGCRIE